KIIHDYNNHDGFKSVRQFFRSGKGEFWLSSNHIGTVLWTDTLSSPQNLIDIDSLFQFRSLDIEQTGDLLWFSITGRGLLVYHQDMDTTFHLTMQSHGLSSDIIDILFAENDSVIWAGSNTGLDRIIIRPDTLLDFKSFNYTTKTGLPSNKIHDIRLFDEHIWVATKKGLVKLLPNFDLENKDNIPSHISQIIVDSKPYHPDSLPTILEAGTHTIEFVMRALSYHIPHNVHYRYKMDNVDEDWTITQKQSVLYRELGQGNYNFQFHASYHSNRFPENTVSLEFKIQKYFHETLAFLIIMTIVILAIIMLIVLWIIQALRRQEQNKQKLLLAEKKALLSQMNPHFIFNSLNSIQHYIIQQDEENANLYLSKFAALIRRILDNSKKKFISLAEEIDTLELYLYLEKLRFEEKFNFSVSKSDDLDNHMVLVPPMIIQPFVENAIWHGLTPLKSGGLLTITFRKTDARMKVVIEVKQDALLLAMNNRSQICTVSGSVELNLTDSGVAWKSGSDSGFNATGLIIMPLNPVGNLIWDETPYPGEFLIQKRGQGLTLINIVELEQYLRGVVPWEIGRPGLIGMAALEAQSVAARTYSIANLKNREVLGFDMWADVRDQVYRGHSGLDQLCDKAISNTAGMILRSGGQIVEAYYCSTCGGKTSNINQVWAKESKPYLVSHPDGPAGNYHCSASKYSKWETVFNGGEIDQTLLITLPEYIEWLEASELRKKWAGKYFIPASPGSDPMTPGRLKNISIQSRTAS
ncbi:MAG: SpoIID/LytB domain-containing protein, partial [Bacteroidetes bacterium]|nr:SpoIID/LytB domain-containing protein [Bacteroidota bacterium]